MNIITNFEKIKQEIKNNLPQRDVKVIAVSKTFSLEHVMPLVKHGHKHFGENKVQEAETKWKVLKQSMINLKLHMIGRLQSNKAKKIELRFESDDEVYSAMNKMLADKERVRCSEHCRMSSFHYVLHADGCDFGVDATFAATTGDDWARKAGPGCGR